MSAYLLRRLVGAVPTLLIVSIIVFLIARLAPGDPATQMLGSNATQAELEAARTALGLNLPLPVQYLAWLRHTLVGDLGVSFTSNQPVWTMIMERLPRTASLTLVSVLISVIIGIPLGVHAAIHRGTFRDQAAMGISLLGLSIPDFVTGLLLIIVFSVNLGWLPAMGYADFMDGPASWLSYLLMPSLSLGLLMAAITARMARSSVLDVLPRDYVVAARAKGMGPATVLYRHVLMNAMIPVVTVIGINVGAVFRGAVIIESLFSIPGVGRLMINGIENRDYPVIQGCLLVIVFLYILINIGVDLLYAWLNPRVRYA